MQWIVVCREDRQGRRKGPYTLATRRVFTDYADAAEYARGIARGREPFIIEGRYSELRFDAPLPAEPATVRQTSCRHCGQDIEGFAPYPAGEWRDRGGNWTCPTPAGDAGQRHEPAAGE